MILKNKIERLKEEFRKELERKPKMARMLKFISKLFLAGLVFRAIIFVHPDTYFFQNTLAWVIQVLMSLSGVSLGKQGALLIGDVNNYLITRDCLGWKSISAFIALIFASTEDLRKEIRILFTGVFLLVLANTVRVWTTVYLSEAGLISFDIIHSLFWRWGMTGIVLLIWYIWLKDPGMERIRGIFK